jgi:predicted phage terminase large subunit-like protein
VETERHTPSAIIDPRSLVPAKYVPYTPLPVQAAFLSDLSEEVFFGGAAGGSKTCALLMAALQYCEVRGYAALLMRRTYMELAQPGSLLDLSHEWLSGTDAHWDGEQHRWSFPSGAKLSFGHLDSAMGRYRYQSSEQQMIGFDEVTEFPESDYRFLFSRLRGAQGLNVPLRMRAASNPGGRGHEWVRTRFVDPLTRVATFYPSKLSDNPHLDATAYTRQLDRLDPVTRARLLHGDWDVRSGGLVFKRETIPVLDAPPATSWSKVRAWDLAGSEGGNYTVGVLMSYGPNPPPNGGWCVEHVVRGRWTPAARDEAILQTARADGKLVRVFIEQEPGSGGIAQAQSITRMLSGFSVTAVRPTGDKLTRAGPVATQAGIGRVAVVRGPWLAAFLDELEAFPDGEFDDQVDALAHSFSALPQSLSRGGASVYVPERGPTAFDDLRGMTIGGGDRR